MFFKPFTILLLMSLFIGNNTSMSREDLVKENEILKSEIEQLKKEIAYSKTEAVLELSKMNVVYRGISNPIKIAMPGAVKIKATAKGLTKVDEFGNYKLAPGVGRTMDIQITGTLKNGNVITDTKTLRIKNIYGVKTLFQGRDSFRKKLKLTKEDIKKGKLTLKIEDFLFDSSLQVIGFTMKSSKGNSIKIQGNKLNKIAKKHVNSLKRGHEIQIFDIIVRSDKLRACKINPVLIEITG